MYIDDFPSHCGSKIFHGFSYSSTGYVPSLTNYRTFFGIFVNNAKQKRTYHSLKKKYKILYQSPILVNPQTDNEYFIVIWLNEKP